MKITVTVEDVIDSFPYHILPKFHGEPDYHTIHAIRKLLQANARSVDSYLGGGTLCHLSPIVSVASYLVVSNTAWYNPYNPGGGPAVDTISTHYIIAEARHQF
jgi:glycine cleavage system pyridoxal-binding protein P